MVHTTLTGAKVAIPNSFAIVWSGAESLDFSENDEIANRLAMDCLTTRSNHRYDQVIAEHPGACSIINRIIRVEDKLCSELLIVDVKEK